MSSFRDVHHLDGTEFIRRFFLDKRLPIFAKRDEIFEDSFVLCKRLPNPVPRLIFKRLFLVLTGRTARRGGPEEITDLSSSSDLFFLHYHHRHGGQHNFPKNGKGRRRGSRIQKRGGENKVSSVWPDLAGEEVGSENFDIERLHFLSNLSGAAFCLEVSKSQPLSSSSSSFFCAPPRPLLSPTRLEGRPKRKRKIGRGKNKRRRKR